FHVVRKLNTSGCVKAASLCGETHVGSVRGPVYKKVVQRRHTVSYETNRMRTRPIHSAAASGSSSRRTILVVDHNHGPQWIPVRIVQAEISARSPGRWAGTRVRNCGPARLKPAVVRARAF